MIRLHRTTALLWLMGTSILAVSGLLQLNSSPLHQRRALLVVQHRASAGARGLSRSHSTLFSSKKDTDPFDKPELVAVVGYVLAICGGFTVYSSFLLSILGYFVGKIFAINVLSFRRREAEKEIEADRKIIDDAIELRDGLKRAIRDANDAKTSQANIATLRRRDWSKLANQLPALEDQARDLVRQKDEDGARRLLEQKRSLSDTAAEREALCWEEERRVERLAAHLEKLEAQLLDAESDIVRIQVDRVLQDAAPVDPVEEKFKNL